MGQQVKDLASLLWLWLQLWSRFDPWPRNFHVLQVWPKKKDKRARGSVNTVLQRLTWSLRPAAVFLTLPLGARRAGGRFLKAVVGEWVLAVFEWSPSVTYRAVVFDFRNARKDYITAKYIERKYARKKHTDNAAKLHSLCEAVKTRDIFGLLQAYADGVDLTEKIPLANGHVRKDVFKKENRSSCHGSAETNPTSIHEDGAQSPISLSGLGIQHCRELWCSSQMRLRSGEAVAVV